MDNDLLIPDRYEALNRVVKKDYFTHFIVEVKDALKEIDEIYSDMQIAARGAFLILYGKSGVGKTTFLHTLPIFREDVSVISIEYDRDINNELKNMKRTKNTLRIIVIEGREALKDSSNEEIEKSLHSINKFLRSDNGLNTLIVWLCNKSEMRDSIIELAEDIGGDALLGVDDGFISFNGPRKKDFINIAKNTISTINEGASLLNLGITDEQANEMIEDNDTIGRYLGKLRNVSKENSKNIRKLVGKEKCKMWVVVIAGNEPRKDVASLTSGSFASADIERMLVATDANIVEDIKQYPNMIGKLSAFFDCKIINIQILAAMSIAREFADPQLREKMKNNKMTVTKDKKAIENLNKSELIRAFQGREIGMGKKGNKVGNNSVDAFGKLTLLASSNDVEINKTIAEALKSVGVIKNYKLEANFGSGMSRRTDILCETDDVPVRLEMMWRKTTGQAEIANYTLNKLYNYGKAIGLLK